MCLAVALGGVGAAAQAADGADLYKARCAACHGTAGGGNAELRAPPLAGSDADYVARQLRHFRSKVRGGEAAGGPTETMQAIAQALPDEESVAALAKFAGSLHAAAGARASQPPASTFSAGRALFSVCMACHGGQGEGTPALGAPRLTHLPSWYVASQLQAYRSGARGAHADDSPGRQMRQVAVELLVDDEAVNAVTAYLSTLGTKH